ncbi:MAG: Peptide synthetase [Candidatus Angelobacter sp.]|nr:Peptide synthetase [Candidatus Angelobacter sp.]
MINPLLIKEVEKNRNDNGSAPMLPVEKAQDRFVHHLTSARAGSNPDSVAIDSLQGRLTYRELDQRANALSQRFRSLGIGRGTVVALWLRRSPWIIAAALAAWKSGAAYLPLDPETPRERLQFMVDDCGAKIVATDSVLAERAGGVTGRVLVLDDLDLRPVEDITNGSIELIRPDDLAYVIYTSGSTGVPKGVEITHANLFNLISWHNSTFQVRESDSASVLAGLGFDASVWEIWPYLAAGATLRLPDSQILNNAGHLRDWLIANGITIAFVPTPAAEQVLALEWPRDAKLRLLLTGGDTLHVRPTPGLPFKVINNYGPTECTVVATSGLVHPSVDDRSLPSIGKPIENSRIYILDENLEPVIVGQSGELYIGGANVGTGYRNRAELTAQRFLPNPFEPGTRMYKTGDLGTFLPNGEIAFLGRADNQIKLRGYRIEPDEIVAVLNSCPGVTASAVTARSDRGDEKNLVAYVVGNSALTRTTLQEFLAERLPEYMIPAAYVAIDNVPFTANGKVDAASLPAPTPENQLRDRTSQADSVIELRLAQIVADLMNLPAVAPDDNFFLLGGHSLLGTQLIARIRDNFGVEIALRALFEQPTVRELAGEVERLLIEKVENMSEEDAQRALRGMKPQSSATHARSVPAA